MAQIILDEGAAAATPAANKVAFYAKVDGLIYSKDDAGVESVVSGASLAGLSTQVFSVAPATAAAHAVRSDQLSADNTNFPLVSLGTVTLTLTGCTTSPTINISYVKIGRLVTLSPVSISISGTSNATTKGLTGLPSNLFPAYSYDSSGIASDNGGATVSALITFSAAGVISLYPSAAANAWTNSGTATFFLDSYAYITA